MKKQLHTLMIAGFSLFAGQTVLAQDGSIPNRGCGATEYQEMEEQAEPSIKITRAQLQEQVNSYIANLKNYPTPQEVITIPVVFHVVYNTAAENVSDACIAQTLIALNKDMRKLNSDFATKTPSVFQAAAADVEIQFCMASKDPSGAATTGITRTPTTVTAFGLDNRVKYNSQGGKDIWDRNKYLNLWVCDMGTAYIGYGQLPGGAAATDGVICHYKYLVSAGGCGVAPYDKGRTTVHEIGHWFGLLHIWGNGGCSSDNIADTPTQQNPSSGCPTFPRASCSNGANGDMFMNYMDYTNDPCMVMFTTGQKNVIKACLNGFRAPLKTSAASVCSSVGVGDIISSEHVSVYPNPSTGTFSMNITIPNISAGDMIVYNALGKAVLQKTITFSSGTDVEVDLNTNPDGMYLIRMETAEGTVIKKIIINK